MFRLVAGLAQMQGWSQAELAEHLGVSQTRISNFFREGTEEASQETVRVPRDFTPVLDGLKAWAKSNPDLWTSLLASSDPLGLFEEYRDLFFLTENFWRREDPEDERGGFADAEPPRRVLADLWVIHREPSECLNRVERLRLAARLKLGQKVYYWLPARAIERVRTLLKLMQQDGVSLPEDRERGMRFIFGPEVIGSLLPLAISDPDGYPLGLTGADQRNAEVRLMVLPTAATRAVVRGLQDVHVALHATPELTLEDGTTWRMLSPAHIEAEIGADAGSSR